MDTKIRLELPLEAVKSLVIDFYFNDDNYYADDDDFTIEYKNGKLILQSVHDTP